jgi:hypothetical protein
MVSLSQNHTIYRAEDLDIPVTLDDVTLTGTETIQAFYRLMPENVLELTAPVEIDANGDAETPAEVRIVLTSADTETLTAKGGRVSHTFALWRVDESAEKPYAIGEATVANTARTGL